MALLHIHGRIIKYNYYNDRTSRTIIQNFVKLLRIILKRILYFVTYRIYNLKYNIHINDIIINLPTKRKYLTKNITFVMGSREYLTITGRRVLHTLYFVIKCISVRYNI